MLHHIDRPHICAILSLRHLVHEFLTKSHFMAELETLGSSAQSNKEAKLQQLGLDLRRVEAAEGPQPRA